MELKILVGKESKDWLLDIEAATERLEKVIAKLNGKSSHGIDEAVDEPTDEVSDEDFDTDNEKQPAKDNDSFDDDDTSFDEVEEEAPAKKSKAKKLTVEDVNEACLKRMRKTGGKKGRDEVLAIL